MEMRLSGGPEDAGVIRSTPTMIYVDALLDQMAEDNRLDLAIRSTEPLPIPRGFLGDVDYPAVANRLKVLCNLNPVNFAKPVSGRFSRNSRMGKVGVFVDFHEAVPESYFQIRLEKTGPRVTINEAL